MLFRMVLALTVLAAAAGCTVSQDGSAMSAGSESARASATADGLRASGPVEPAASATESEVLNGWPDTSRNLAGVYSWDGSRCGRPPFPSGSNCIIGFMHNGYGSGDVEIRLGRPPREAIIGGPGTAVTVAGHDSIYRRIDDLREEWVVDIEKTTIVIHLSARPGTSQSDLDEAYAIIDSMRAEARDNDVGFRLVFTLTTDDWDSG